MSRHQDILDQLVAYMDREVSDADRLRIDEHLSGCAECRHELDVLRDVIQLTHAPERLRANTAFVERVRAGIERRPTWLQRHVAQWMTPWVAAAMIAGLGAGGFVVWRVFRTLPVAGVFERVKTASGYVTIQDRDGIRDVPKSTRLHDGTAVMTVEQQYVTVHLTSRQRVTLMPFSLMMARTPESGEPGRVDLRYGRAYIVIPRGAEPWRVITPHGVCEMDEGAVYVEVTSSVTRLVVVEGGLRPGPQTPLPAAARSKVVEWHADGRTVSVAKERAAKWVMEARLKAPLSLEDLKTIPGVKGMTLKEGLEVLARRGRLPPFQVAPDVPVGGAVADDPSGFLFEDTLQNLVWPFHAVFDVTGRGIAIRRMTPADRTLPLSWESLPIEYRDLIKAYFEKIGQRFPR